MAKKSGYLQKQEARTKIAQQATKETYMTFILELLTLTLNDKELWGSDAFGKKRLDKLFVELDKNYVLYEEALSGGNEAGYKRDKLTEALRKINGDEVREFEERYPWIKRVI